MKPYSILKAEYTSTLHRVGVSAARPVNVSSWIADIDRTREDLTPGNKDYPGWHYGSTVSLYKQDDRPHDHAHFEICIIRQGSILHRTAYSCDELGPGRITILYPGMVHAIDSSEDLHQTNLYYLTEWLANDLMSHWKEAGFVPLFLAAALFRRPPLGPIPQFTLNPGELGEIDHELANITQEISQDKSSQTFLRSCLLKMLILMSRAAARDSSIELSLKFRQDVVGALEYIEKILLQRDTFRVSDLAEVLGLPSANLAAQFQKSTGWGPMAYYQHRRIQHACQLLVDPENSITDVAYELGYSDSSHFTHQFKKHQSMSPTDYRRLYSKLGDR